MITIKDLAKMTGFSPSMISRVINNYPYVDEEKRQIILKAIEETNFQPNSIARQLSSGKKQNVGVIIPYPDSPYFEQIVSGVLTAAFKENYKVTLLPTNYDKQIEMNYLNEFATKLYDGIIITSKSNTLEAILPYQKYGPLIFCESVKTKNVACVSIDREKAFLDMLTFFKKKRITKIGITVGRNEKESDSSKLLLSLATQYLSNFDDSCVVRNCLNEEDGYLAAKQFETFEGIITNGDEVSAGVYEFYKDKPNKPIIIGQDNLLISKLLNLSTIDYHLKECGKKAFSLFLENKVEKITIDPNLIIRE